MSFYKCEGKIPQKRHTAFYNNEKICYEELISRQGFSGVYSNVYHLNRPTKIIKVGSLNHVELNQSAKKHRARHIVTSDLAPSDLLDKKDLFFNSDLIISIICINQSTKYFYKNGIEDELLYVQYGNGKLISNFGNLEFKAGDYIVIPRGIIYQFKLNDKAKLLSVQSREPIESPSKYKNKQGQLLEHSPFCERDIRTPILQDPKSEEGEFIVKVKTEMGYQDYHYANHPFDIIGWDGFYYPWILSIHDFEPVVGRIHQPPPVHQTFQSKHFVICSFVPRPFDFHPDSIPAPYPHSNVDSDEVIYYSKGNFMSRKGIQEESITLHPMGLPHGPQPGKYQSSIGKTHTDELAVMIDTFKSLKITENSIKLDDPTYPLSWSK